jgi:hypothetical protein
MTGSSARRGCCGPWSTIHQAPFNLGVGLYQICASAVAAATPHRYRLTDLLHDRNITDVLATALHRAASQPEAGDGESRWSWRPRRW